MFLLSLLISFSFAYESKPVVVRDNTYKVYHPPVTSEVFVPPGYDDTDNVEITFRNVMPNSCYLTTHVTGIEKDLQNKKIRIAVEATVLKADFCAMRYVSYPITVNVGELPSGDYELEFQTSERAYTEAIPFSVTEAQSSSRDDFEYASLNLNLLTVVSNRVNREIEVALPFVFPNGCYGINEVRVFNERAKNIIEILPILERKPGPCTDAIEEVTQTVKVPTSVGGLKLIHIRSANGFSINRLLDI